MGPIHSASQREGFEEQVNDGISKARKLKGGTILVNTAYGSGGWEIEVPMGGFKHSGVGREYGIEGMSQYQETKTIVYGS